MTLDLYFGLFIFAVIMAFTPGPNNALMMANGIDYGFRRTLPAALGVSFGFPFLTLCIGLGLGTLFVRFPVLMTVLKVGGSLYMVWLAWKIATSKPSESESDTASKPLNFLQTFFFQWVNPKAWIMAIAALANYTLPDYYWTGLACVVGTFIFTGITSSTTWAGFGAGLKAVMHDPRWYRAINIALALLLLASLVPMLRH